MYNPVRHVAGGRRRQRIGAEFQTCKDGSQAKLGHCPEDTPHGDIPIDIIRKPGGGGWTGGWTNKPGGTPGGGFNPPYTPGGGGYTPPGSGGGTPGGGTPPDMSTPPYGDPGIPVPGGCDCGVPVGCRPTVDVCPENQKRIVLPFIPDAGYTASVTAGSEVRFVGRPQYLFKPERMIIASSIAPFFDIVNFSIGNSPQSLASGNYSAEMYSEVSTYTDMSFDQCYPGIDVIIVAKNKSSVTQTFQVQLVGWADKP